MARGRWCAISTGNIHTCAISTGKSLYCWGGNFRGQLGDGTISARLSPKKIGASGGWASVSAGKYHTCAISTGKSLYCWGYNDYGQVGDGTDGTDRPSRTKIGASGGWANVAAGDYHTCAISTGKSLYCWGLNSFGQIGDGTDDTRLTPKKIGASGGWAGAAGGTWHSCGISTSKSLYCWGKNVDGQSETARTPTVRAPRRWARPASGRA